jgi:hypothetical protein
MLAGFDRNRQTARRNFSLVSAIHKELDIILIFAHNGNRRLHNRIGLSVNSFVATLLSLHALSAPLYGNLLFNGGQIKLLFFQRFRTGFVARCKLNFVRSGRCGCDSGFSNSAFIHQRRRGNHP